MGEANLDRRGCLAGPFWPATAMARHTMPRISKSCSLSRNTTRPTQTKANSEDAEDLLQDIWDDNDSEDWVNGSSNTGYLSIKKLHDNWDDSDSVANYSEVVSVLSTSPAGSGKTYANYTVTHNLSYTGDKDDTSVTDTYQNEIISQDSDGDYVLEKLGTPNAK